MQEKKSRISVAQNNNKRNSNGDVVKSTRGFLVTLTQNNIKIKLLKRNA